MNAALASAWRMGTRALRNFLDQEGVQWAGAVAFYLVLSVPPLMIAAAAIGLAVVGDATAKDFVASRVADFVPVQRELLARVTDQAVGASGLAAIAAIAFLLFSGTRVFAALVTALHVMWHDVEEASFVRMQLTRLFLLLSVGVLFITAAALDLLVVVAGELIPLPAFLHRLVGSQLIPVVLSACGLFVVFALIPRRRASIQSAVVGALIGTLLLRVAQFGFTTYVAWFGGFESAYGPVASLAALMTWALVASAVVLLAGHLVAVMNQADQPGTHRRPGDEADPP